MAFKVDLSLEIPTAILERVIEETDLGFSLAHLLLTDKEYLRHYKSSENAVLMDNSMYELDEPLSLDKLFEAAKISTPAAIIAPDWEGDSKRTSENAVLMRAHLEAYWGKENDARLPTTGIVVQGKDLIERREFFYWAQGKGFRPICFPFRLRQERSPLLHAIAEFKDGGWYHLLGLNNTTELTVAKSYPGRWSVDTAKPCKPGFDMALDPWRGRGKLDFSRKYSREELQLVLQNITWLKKFL